MSCWKGRHSGSLDPAILELPEGESGANGGSEKGHLEANAVADGCITGLKIVQYRTFLTESPVKPEPGQNLAIPIL